METLIRILAVFVLVAANGFFVTSEFAIVSVRRMRIATLAEGGDKRARRLLAFKDNLGAYISATQLGVTLSSLALGWIGEATLAEQLVNISHKSGHLEEEERRLINRVFDFSEAEVREAMIPRTEVQALPVTATLEDAEHAFCEFGYSRLPVYGERLDDVAGVLFMKDLMPCLRTVNPSAFDMESML